jgi:hypothetical protein
VNLARYNLETHRLDCCATFPELTPEDMRVLTLQFQMAMLCEGTPASGILVAWQDAPSDYIGIFMLGDMVDQPVPSTMLDRIERLARGH